MFICNPELVAGEVLRSTSSSDYNLIYDPQLARIGFGNTQRHFVLSLILDTALQYDKVILDGRVDGRPAEDWITIEVQLDFLLNLLGRQLPLFWCSGIWRLVWWAALLGYGNSRKKHEQSA
jgi:hypothetical protein